MDTMTTSSSETALATRQPAAISAWRFIPTTLSEAMEMAKILSSSGLVPDHYRNKPYDCMVAYEYGSALGLSWMQALRSVAVINGQGALWGDAVPALILGSGQCERFHEEFRGKEYDDDYTAVCIMKRKGLPDEVVRTFSVKDAKVAKLWGKVGRSGGDTPWVTYPKRMLQMRARGFAARDAFPDKLSGLILAEEAMDYPEAIEGTVVSVDGIPPSLLDKVETELRGRIEEGFKVIGMTPAQQLTKVNEYLSGDPDPSRIASQAAKLVEWLKDEYSRQKTGKSLDRSKAADNAKTRQNAPEGQGNGKSQPAQGTAASGTPGPAGTAPAAGSGAAPTPATPASGTPQGSAQPGGTTAAKADQPLTATDIPFGGSKPSLPPGEMF